MMEKTGPNEYGVYPASEELEIALPKKSKGQIKVRLAKGEDGFYRWGYCFMFGDGGASALPSKNGDVFETRYGAISAAVEFIRSRAESCDYLPAKEKAKLLDCIGAFLESQQCSVKIVQLSLF